MRLILEKCMGLKGERWGTFLQATRNIRHDAWQMDQASVVAGTSMPPFSISIKQLQKKCHQSIARVKALMSLLGSNGIKDNVRCKEMLRNYWLTSSLRSSLRTPTNGYLVREKRASATS